MAAFAAVAAVRFSQTGSLFFALLFCREIFLAVLFMKRISTRRQGSAFQTYIAYGSTILPLFYVSPGAPILAWVGLTASILAIIGFSIATFAAIELGSRMGVSPAARGERCMTGVYRWFRHPMYAGYIIAESGWTLIHPVNIVLFAVSFMGYGTRAQAEDILLAETCGERN